MRNGLITLVVALVACATSFGLFYAANREPAALRTVARDGDAMEWLRVEFKLSDAQFAAIRKLHTDYASTCNRHCAAIAAAEKRNAPRMEITALENECVQSMTDHFHRVAELMAPDEGPRYLAIVLPRIHDYDHRGSPNVQGER